MRVVLDTSVLISIFIFSTEKMNRFKQPIARHQVVLCSYVIDELKDVVSRKFPDRMKDIDTFLLSFPFIMSYTPEHFDKEDYPNMRDEADVPILVSAILEDVDVLISRDKDFLALDIEKPEICDIDAFLEAY